MKPFIVLLITILTIGQSFAQSQIEKGFGQRYKYEGVRLEHRDIKKLILSIEDSIAHKYYSNYKTGTVVGGVSLIGGGVILGAGAIIYFDEWSNGWTLGVEPVEEETLQKGRILMWTGGILTVIGAVTIGTSGKSLNNAINRYNSLQKQTSLNFGITKSGIGLIYNF